MRVGLRYDPKLFSEAFMKAKIQARAGDVEVKFSSEPLLRGVYLAETGGLEGWNDGCVQLYGEWE